MEEKMATLKKNGITLVDVPEGDVEWKKRLGWEVVQEGKEPSEEPAAEEGDEEVLPEEDQKVIAAVDKVVGKMGLEDPELLRQIPDEEILGLDDVGQVTLERVRVVYPKEGE